MGARSLQDLPILMTRVADIMLEARFTFIHQRPRRRHYTPRREIYQAKPKTTH